MHKIMSNMQAAHEPLHIPIHVRTDCKNCAKRKVELQRMANSLSEE